MYASISSIEKESTISLALLHVMLNAVSDEKNPAACDCVGAYSKSHQKFCFDSLGKPHVHDVPDSRVMRRVFTSLHVSISYFLPL